MQWRGLRVRLLAAGRTGQGRHLGEGNGVFGHEDLLYILQHHVSLAIARHLEHLRHCSVTSQSDSACICKPVCAGTAVQLQGQTRKLPSFRVTLEAGGTTVGIAQNMMTQHIANHDMCSRTVPGR